MSVIRTEQLRGRQCGVIAVGSLARAIGECEGWCCLVPNATAKTTTKVARITPAKAAVAVVGCERCDLLGA